MKMNVKPVISGISGVSGLAAASLLLFCQSAQAVTDAELVGLYKNYSESSFVFTLKLDKDGKATWTEPDPVGGKSLVLIGKWQLAGSQVELKLAKTGSYRYAVKENLPWESFGCKGGSFGLAIEATPKGASKDAGYHVWRAGDLKKAERCQRV